MQSVIRTRGQLENAFRNLWKAIQDGPVKLSAKRWNGTRSNEQNRMLWAICTDLAKGMEWHGQRLTKEDWKDLLTAAMRRQRFVPGINVGDGEPGVVALGARTSQMSVEEVSNLIEFAQSFAAEQGVELGK